MRKCLIAIVLSLIAGQAPAQIALPDNAYIGVFGGGSGALEGDFTLGPIVGLSFGIDNDRGPIELEISRRARSVVGPDNVTDGDEEVTAFMVNGFYRLNQLGSARVSPYVGGGIGIATNFSVPGTSGTDGSALAAQAMAGIEYKLGGATSLTGEVRYFVTETFDVDIPIGTADWQIESLDIIIGLRVQF